MVAKSLKASCQWGLITGIKMAQVLVCDRERKGEKKIQSVLHFSVCFGSALD